MSELKSEGISLEDKREHKRQYEVLNQMGFTSLANRHLLAGAPHLPDLIRANIEDHVMSAQQREAELTNPRNIRKLRRAMLERDLDPILDQYLETLLGRIIEPHVREIADKHGGHVLDGELSKRAKDVSRYANTRMKHDIIRGEVDHPMEFRRDRSGPLSGFFIHDILEAGAPYFDYNKPYLERNARKEKRSAAHHTVVSRREAKRERWGQRTRKIGKEIFPEETAFFRDKYS